MTIRRFAILYARFSPRAKAETCPSCDVQLEDLRRYCERNGLTIKVEFRDDAKSGKSIRKREGLIGALKAVKAGDVFLCRDTSRLTRNMIDAFKLATKITAKGATLITLEDGTYDPDDTNSVLGFGVRAVVNHVNRMLISQKTSAKMRRKQLNGERMSDIAPFGYTRDPEDGKRLVPVAEEQETLERIKALAGNYGVRKIARMLTAEGRLCRGRDWNHKTVSKCLRREAEKEART